MKNGVFKLPNLSQRTTVIGRTGSGKTILGYWLLSQARFDKQAFIIIDYKLDETLNGVDRIKEIAIGELPKYPGLYIAHPKPSIDDEAMEKWFYQIWDRGNIGLYFDEMYMVPQTAPLIGMLTQGRSKRIPIISLTQRPVEISRFAFSEADYISLFYVSDQKDYKRIREFTGLDATERLAQYWSRWYDVGQMRTFILEPVPEPRIIQDIIHERLKPERIFV